MIKKWKNLSLIKNNREKSVNKLTLSNTMNLTNNGMKTYFKLNKKMLKHLVLLKTDTLKKLSKIDKFLKKSFH